MYIYIYDRPRIDACACSARDEHCKLCCFTGDICICIYAYIYVYVHVYINGNVYLCVCAYSYARSRLYACTCFARDKHCKLFRFSGDPYICIYVFISV